jgi:hypothetical protein
VCGVRRLEFILATLAVALAFTGIASAGRASAGTTRWTITEVQAERWARQHVTYFDDDAWGEHVQAIENARAGVKECNDYPDWKARFPFECAQDQREYDALNAMKRSDFILYPRSVACRGNSPSRDAYHFWRFRCRAQFSVGYGNVSITVTGKNRAVWRWL